MTPYSKFNPGTYWGKGYGANELQQPSLVTEDSEEANPLDLIKRYFSPSSSSSSSRDQDPKIDWSGNGNESPSSLSPTSRALASTFLKQGANYAGIDPRISGFIPSVISLLSGDEEGALRQGVGTATGIGLNELGAPAPIIGPVANLVSSYVGGDSPTRIVENVVDSGIGSVASYALGPVAGTLYSIARMAGFKPSQGFGEMFGAYKDLTPGYEGGFWGKQGVGEGVTFNNPEYITTAQAADSGVLANIPVDGHGLHLSDTPETGIQGSLASPFGYAMAQYAAQLESQRSGSDPSLSSSPTGWGGYGYSGVGSSPSSGGDSSLSSSPTGWGGYGYSGVGSSPSSGGDSSDSSDGGW